jgi:hypothetical protein
MGAALVRPERRRPTLQESRPPETLAKESPLRSIPDYPTDGDILDFLVSLLADALSMDEADRARGRRAIARISGALL